MKTDLTTKELVKALRENADMRLEDIALIMESSRGRMSDITDRMPNLLSMLYIYKVFQNTGKKKDLLAKAVLRDIENMIKTIQKE